MKVLQGTFRNDRANPDEPKPEIPDVLNAPAWLDDYGREAWDKLVPQLVKLGLFTSLDLLFFAMICADYSVFRRATDCTKGKLTHDTGANGRCALPEIAIARAAFDRVRQGLNHLAQLDRES
jgi:P27 family predicted phage terminase small subunit